jgi:hypothetical protein
MPVADTRGRGSLDSRGMLLGAGRFVDGSMVPRASIGYHEHKLNSTQQCTNYRVDSSQLNRWAQVVEWLGLVGAVCFGCGWLCLSPKCM